MKAFVAMAALGAALVLAGAACGGSTLPAGHGILLVRGLKQWDARQIVLWRPGSAPTPLGPTGWGISGPVWSPDGRSIAFSKETVPPENGPLLNEIFVMRADGTNIRQLSHDSNLTVFNSNGNPSWAPDGRYLVYPRVLSTQPWGDTVFIDAQAGHERIERSAAGEWGRPGIASWDGSGITLTNPATGRSRLMAPGVVPDSYAGSIAWSSSGVLAVTQRKRIVLLAASGRVIEMLPIPSGSTLVCGVAWSPNGKQILAWAAKPSSGFPAETVGLWVATVSTKHWRRLPLPITKPGEYGCALSWR